MINELTFAKRNAGYCVKNPRRAWATVKAMREYAKANPLCAWCGRMKIDVHHIEPISVRPDRAADKSNMISLCRKPQCHLVIGHRGNFKAANLMVRETCEGRK